MSSRRLRFGIVGCGVISGIHAKSIAENENAELVAVCDIVEERATRLAERYSAACYFDYREMLKRNDIDVISVCTPSGMHSEHGIMAANAGKHVIVEKPIDTTLKKAQRLIDSCKESNVTLSVILQHRYDDAIIRLRDDVSEGRLGVLNFGGSHTKWYRSQEYYDSGDWRGTLELDGGGALINQSIHYVDLLQYIMGLVEEVQAYCATRAHERIEVEDIAVASVKFRNGALGIIEGNTAAYPGFCTRLDIYGSEGSIIIENDRIIERRLKSEPGSNSDSIPELDPDGADKEKPRIKEEESGATVAGAGSQALIPDSHCRQYAEIIDALLTGKPVSVDGEEGIKSLAIVLAIYESARSGRAVRL